MGKKPAAKKKGKANDARGYATSSIASATKAVDEATDDAAAAAEDVAEATAAATSAGATSAGVAGVDAIGTGGGGGPQPVPAEEEEEEWERAGEDEPPQAAAVAGAHSGAGGAGAEADAANDPDPIDDEEWEKAVERRVDEEVQRYERKFIPADATSQLERRGGAAPAGVVVLKKEVEQRVEAALTQLRDEEGLLQMTFPKHWRYKGKLTYERLNGIYLALESLNFKSEHVRWAMGKTVGYDVRAPLEFLLANLGKEDLPRQFGGEGLGDEADGPAGSASSKPQAQASAAVPASAAETAEPTSPETEPAVEAEVEAPREGGAEAEVAEEADAQAAAAEAAEAETGSGGVPDEGDGPAEDEGEALAEPSEDAVLKDAPAAENVPEEPATKDSGEGRKRKSKKKPETKEAPKEKVLAAKDEDDFTRRWAAQYCAGGGDSDSDGVLLTEEEKLDRERRKDPTARFLKVAKEFDKLVALTRALKEKKKSGAFKQNVSADMARQREATARMAAYKREMEDFEAGKYGTLDKDKIAAQRPSPVAKARAEAAQKKAAEAAAAAAAAEKEKEKEKAAAAASGEGDEEGMPSLFDSNPGDEPSCAPSEGLPVCRQYGVVGWTGRTPKQAIEDYTRQKLFGKTKLAEKVASYEQPRKPVAGKWFWAKVHVRMPRNQPTQTYDPEEPALTKLDAENLAAIWALHHIAEEADRPGLARSFPPAFRQRWQEWEQEAANKARELTRELVRNRIRFVEQLLRKKPAVLSRSAPAPNEGVSAPAILRGGGLAEADDEDFTELGSDAAHRLRADFARRHSSWGDDPAFASMQEMRQRLPVGEYKEALLRVIKGNGVTVVSGATGSGKTTQVPQFILEDALEEGGSDGPIPNIIVTEPRRISAVSVAKRVSEELGDPRGGPGSRGALVGYQIRLEKKISDSTRLMFCTVGVLLKKMQQGHKSLSRVTHIFIDEVHERSADCDLLLLLLRQVRHQRPELRVVLMSATMETNKLVRYFGANVPVVSIPGRTFPVESFWLEDVVQMTGYRCEEESEFAKRNWNRGKDKKMTFQVAGQKGKSETLTAYVDEEEDWGDDEAEGCDPAMYDEETTWALSRMDHTRINFDLIELILEYIEGADQFAEVSREDGAVLVFLPGLMEITKVHERLSRNPIFGNPARCLVISLHSVLSGDEHAKAFERPRRGVRKIVLSTNIAETGVTIPDVAFVIDSGKVKSQKYHEPSNTSSLKEQFVSRAEILQRRGRAGRVREGFGFHLMTRRRFELRLQDMPTPEILRCSLMELMLSVMSSGLQPSCFSEALDPPPKTRIDQAVATLKATGAVEEGVRPADAPNWGPLADDAWYVPTPLGLCLSRLPCDLRLGKMVLLAALFGGIEAVWTIAATLSHRSPLATPFSDSKRAQAKQAHVTELLAKDAPPSDHLAVHQAFKNWEEAKRGKGVESFCRRSWLNNQVLQSIKDIRKDFVDSCKSEGFCEVFSKDEVPVQEIKSSHSVAALLFAGLFPNVARLDPPKGVADKNPIFSAGSEQLRLHPGSLCHGRVENLHRTNHRWACYHTKLKTTQVYLRDATFLTPNALLLFGGDTTSMNIHPSEKSVSLGAGAERQWHTLHCSPRTAALVRQLRHVFDALLRRKASDPRRPLGTEDRAVVAAYLGIMNSVDIE